MKKAIFILICILSCSLFAACCQHENTEEIITKAPLLTEKGEASIQCIDCKKTIETIQINKEPEIIDGDFNFNIEEFINYVNYNNSDIYIETSPLVDDLGEQYTFEGDPIYEMTFVEAQGFISFHASGNNITRICFLFDDLYKSTYIALAFGNLIFEDYCEPDNIKYYASKKNTDRYVYTKMNLKVTNNYYGGDLDKPIAALIPIE